MGLLKKTWQKAKAAFSKVKSKFDKQGSYTGTPDEGRRPEQDADDL